MIDKLIGFSIKHKAVIGFITLLLVAWGIYSLLNLSIDAVPDITDNQVAVHAVAPALVAQEVEQTITSPLEIAMANIPGVIEIRSISRFGLAVITIVFKEDVNIYTARQLVAQKLTEAQDVIPKGIAQIQEGPISTGLGEIYQYVLQTKPGYDSVYSPTDLRTMQDWIVKRQLEGTPGVAEINSFGGYIKQYEVAINPDQLRSMNLTITDIFNALAANNQNTGGAYIEKGHNAYFIRGLGLVKTLDDVGKIVVKNTSSGVPILIRDVAKVQFGSAVRYGALTINGKEETVGGVVLMLKGENSVQVINRVKDKIALIQKSLPEGVEIQPYLDRSDFIGRTISTVSHNLIEGGLIVIFVLVLLLGNLRAGLVVASVIPLSMLFAVSMMNIFGVSGNLMSLGAIDFGLIVDGAVIIVEAVVHRITESYKLSDLSTINQSQFDEIVFQSAVRIRKSAAFGEIIILIVYIPILTLVGIEGKMFRPMAMTVSFAIFGALILSLTYVPMMSALFLSKKIKAEYKKNISEKIMERIHKLYEPAIHFALRKKKLVVFSAFILFVIALFVFNNLGGVFLPTLEEGDFAVETRLASGSSLSQTIETTLKAGKILREKFPEVKEVVCRIGVADIPTDPDPIETSMMMIVLKDKSEWVTADNREELADKMKEALSVIPGVNYEFQQPIQLRFNELMTGIRQDVAVKIYGDDLNVLAQLGNQASSLISKVNGAVDVLPEKTTGMPQITVEYNRDKIAQYGLTIDDVNKVLESAFAGAKAGVVYEGDRRFDLVVRFDRAHRVDIDDVQNLFIPLSNGSQIPLSEVAAVELKKGPTQILRDNTKRRIAIGLNVRGRDVQSVVNDIQTVLNKNLKLPSGYYITYGGQFQNLIQAKNRLMIAVPLSLALIFVLLFFTFNSIKESLLIFTAIPLAAIGGVFALLIRGLPFSISAGVGFIALFGVAVLNGIVLISYFNQLEKEGVKDINERILQGTNVRLRPVVMTAAVASLGFLPMAISTTAGAEVQRPLATVVIGGLITSTLLTLVVLPVLYSIFFSGTWKRFLSKWFGRKSNALLLFALVFAAASFTSYAQTNQTLDKARTIKLNLNEAIKIALKNNPGLASARYSVEQQDALGKTAFDLGKTTITYDKDNTPPNGNYGIGFSQTISFPTVYLQQNKLQNQNITLSEKSYEAVKSELIKNVKSAYYQLAYGKERLKLFTYQESVYKNFSDAAELRYKTGETSQLENLAAQSKYQEVQLQKKQAEADLIIYEKELQKFLNINEPIELIDTTLEKIQFVPLEYGGSIDSTAIESNPVLNFYRQKINTAESEHALEVHRLLPDLTFGYSKLTDNSVFNYYGFQIGVSVPLWFLPQQGRIEAASIGEKIAQSNYQNYRLLIQSSYQQQLKEYEKWKEQINYYEITGLKQADEILKVAELRYRNGEIGYVEFIQNISQAIGIKTQYLDALNQYNQSLINLNYLAGR
ncbi:MAG: CusA/CzcA family heavy metal efflux RND transporter [Stygiobacter sp.]